MLLVVTGCRKFSERPGLRGAKARWVVDIFSAHGARFIETDAAAVSRLVDRLAGKGLVARSPDPASRRRVLLALTPPAAGLVPMLVELADQNDEAFFGTLPLAQRAELAGLLQRLLSQARTVSHDNRGKKENES
jgi:hypothetical protein